MDNVVCFIKMSVLKPALHPSVCCVKQRLLSLQRSRRVSTSLSESCYFFEKPSGFVFVSCLSLSPLKLIDRSRKCSAQLLSLTHPKEVERNSKVDHPSSTRAFVCVHNVKQNTCLGNFSVFFSQIIPWRIIVLQMKMLIRVKWFFCCCYVFPEQWSQPLTNIGWRKSGIYASTSGQIQIKTRQKKDLSMFSTSSSFLCYLLIALEDFYRTTWGGFYDISVWLITCCWRDVRLSETDNVDFYLSAFLCKMCHQSSVSCP